MYQLGQLGYVDMKIYPLVFTHILYEHHYLQVLAEYGLGKFVDPEFVKVTSKELQEALNMTQEEMDRAAHKLIIQERDNQFSDA